MSSPDSSRIFVVEDENHIATVLRDYLVREGFLVEVYGDGRSALQAFRADPPDLVLLDLMLPELDGLSVCREIRQFSEVPVLLLTAKVEEVDRIVGLEIGADDYICKPFSPREVVARVKANLRRWKPPGQGAAESSQGLVHLESFQRFTLDGQTLPLTQTEYKLLALMQSSPGRVYSRAQLLDLCYDQEQDVSDRAIDSHVKNLRKKLRDFYPVSELIHSVYGVGYRYEPVSSFSADPGYRTGV